MGIFSSGVDFGQLYDKEFAIVYIYLNSPYSKVSFSPMDYKRQEHSANPHRNAVKTLMPPLPMDRLPNATVENGPR
jgi:hypothetical protein